MANDFSINAVLTANASKFTSAIEGAIKTTENLSNGFQKIGKIASSLFIGGAFAKAIQVMGDVSTSFADAESNIVKGTGAIGEELNILSKSVSNSMLNGVGRSAEEIGAMIADLNTRFGVTGETLETMVDEFDMFASVTNTDVKTSINSVADLMAKWNIETEDTNDVLDQLVKASQMSGASIETLTSGLKSGQSIFSQFGMNVTKSTAFLASLSKNGVDSSIAITGLRTALAKWSNEGKNAEIEFKKISEDIRNAKTESEALNIAFENFGSRSGAEMVKVLRSGSDSLNKFEDALNHAGGTLKMTDELSRTSKDAFEDLVATIKGMINTITGNTDKALKDLIDNLRNLILNINLDELKTKFNDFKDAFVLVVNFLSQTFLVFYNNFKMILNKLSDALGINTINFNNWKQDLYNGLNTLYKIFQDAFNSISALLNGDFILAWKYFQLALLRIFNGIQESIQQLMSNINDGLFGKIIEGVKTVVNIASIISPSFRLMKEAIDKVYSTISEKLPDFSDAVEKTEKEIEEITGKPADKNLANLNKLEDAHNKYSSEVIDGEIQIQEATDETGDKAKETSDETKKKVLGVLSIIGNSCKNTLAGITKGFTTAFKTIANIVSSAINSIKNIISGLSGVFSKLFEFNIDDSIQSLLEFEDAVLTFFLETLPHLPSFFNDAMGSIAVLMSNVTQIISGLDLQSIFGGIIDSLTEYGPGIFEDIITSLSTLINNLLITITNKAPEIVGALGSMVNSVLGLLPDLATNIMSALGSLINEVSLYFINNEETITNDLVLLIQNIIQGLTNFIENGGWKNLLDAFLSIQRAIETAVTENIDELVDDLISMLPDLIDTLVDSIVSASKTLAKIAKPLIKGIVALIMAIIDVITSDEVIDASIEAIEGIVEALMSELLPKIPNLLMKIINFILIKLPSYTPKLISGIIKSLIKGFTETNWGEVISEMFQGFIDGIKDLFGIHSPSSLFEWFGEMMSLGLSEGLEGIMNIIDSVFTGLKSIIDSIIDSFSQFTDDIKDVIDGLSGLTEISFDGLNETLKTLSDSLIKVTQVSFDGIKGSVTSLFNGLSNITSISFSGLNSTIKTLSDSFVAVNNSIINTISSLKELATVKIWDEEDSTASNIAAILTGGLSKLFGFATGVNNAPKGLALVGEQGPELVDFSGGERVYTTQNTKKILEGTSSGGNTMNVTFNNLKDTTASAMMAQLRYYNRQLAIDGIL